MGIRYRKRRVPCRRLCEDEPGYYSSFLSNDWQIDFKTKRSEEKLNSISTKGEKFSCFYRSLPLSDLAETNSNWWVL